MAIGPQIELIKPSRRDGCGMPYQVLQQSSILRNKTYQTYLQFSATYLASTNIKGSVLKQRSHGRIFRLSEGPAETSFCAFRILPLHDTATLWQGSAMHGACHENPALNIRSETAYFSTLRSTVFATNSRPHREPKMHFSASSPCHPLIINTNKWEPCARDVFGQFQHVPTWPNAIDYAIHTQGIIVVPECSCPDQAPNLRSNVLMCPCQNIPDWWWLSCQFHAFPREHRWGNYGPNRTF